MNNKKLGNGFETELCEMLSSHGFWVHLLNANASGQPADLIAAKNGKAYLIDCKVCSGNGFRLNRMEENQDLAMTLWKKCGNGEGWFAILLEEETYMIPHFDIRVLSNDQSMMSPAEVIKCGKPFEKWVAK